MNESAPKSAPGSAQSIRGNIIFAFALAFAIYVAWLLRSVLVLLYVSALFAVVLAPVVRATSRLRIGRWHPFHGATAIFFLLLMVAAAFTAFGFLALPPVIRDLQALNGEMPTRLPALVAWLRQFPLVGRLNSAEIINSIQGSVNQTAAALLTSLTNWADAIVQVAAGFVLTLYFILEGEGAYHWFLSFVPPQPRQRLDKTLRRAAGRMEKWLIGQASLMLILGVASTILYLALNIRYAYGLGVLTGLLNIIPVLGAIISIALAILVAAIDSWGRVLGVAIFFLVYLQIENSWLIPRVMKHRVHLPALAIFVALLLGSAVEGVVGAMVAIPTAVLVEVLIDEYLVKKSEE
ncbi:MAG: AI-2E family transporter [Terracidiphilus sp.]|jgi:predicted PurR-regulated permease PerM